MDSSQSYEAQQYYLMGWIYALFPKLAQPRTRLHTGPVAPGFVSTTIFGCENCPINRKSALCLNENIFNSQAQTFSRDCSNIMLSLTNKCAQTLGQRIKDIALK